MVTVTGLQLFPIDSASVPVRVSPLSTEALLLGLALVSWIVTGPIPGEEMRL